MAIGLGLFEAALSLSRPAAAASLARPEEGETGGSSARSSAGVSEASGGTNKDLQ